ncbi:MAG: DUF4389 domain-containing protein, partial [Dehalococcoidia bacterium]
LFGPVSVHRQEGPLAGINHDQEVVNMEEAPQAVTGSVTLDIAHPESLSRWHLLAKVFLGWIYVGIPHGIILYFYSIAVGVVTFIAFWVILFTGRYPKGLFDFVVGLYRWQMRVTAYLSLLRDEYPPFSGQP